MAKRMFETWGPRLGITERRERPRATVRAARARGLRPRPARQGPRHPRDGRERESHRRADASGAPTTRTRASTTASPRSTRCSATRSSACARCRATPSTSRSATSATTTRSTSTTCGPRTTPPTARRRCGRSSMRRGTPTSRCSTCRASSAATTRPPTGSSTASSTPPATPYAAQHDLDANKPGGSIKIRVKTYSHSLKMHTEALEDVAQAARGRDAATTSSKKRLELLKLKRGSARAAQADADPSLMPKPSPRSPRRSRVYQPQHLSRWSRLRRPDSFSSRRRTPTAKPSPSPHPIPPPNSSLEPVMTQTRINLPILNDSSSLAGKLAASDEPLSPTRKSRSTSRPTSAPSASASASKSERRQWVDEMIDPAVHQVASEREQRHAAHQRPHQGAGLPRSRAPSAAWATTSRTSAAPTPRACRWARSTATAASATPPTSPSATW